MCACACGGVRIGKVFVREREAIGVNIVCLQLGGTLIVCSTLFGGNGCRRRFATPKITQGKAKHLLGGVRGRKGNDGGEDSHYVRLSWPRLGLLLAVESS